MSCPVTRAELCAWVQAEEDDAAVVARIEAHIAVCHACRTFADEMRAALFDLRAAASPPQAPHLPAAIGPYRITGKLGTGGMGVVYAAEQAAPRRRVALKVIRGAHSEDEVQRRLFARELHALARLNHPHIASIYDAGRTDAGEPYFAMEYIDGVDLLTFAARPRATPGSQPLSLRERIALVAVIARAISHAHERGIVHRDLKPGNILITANGSSAGATPKILDFGLARVLDAEAADVRATRAGVVMGTLAYMSPEQARGDVDALDIRSDVYSLGVILYELLTGALPIDVTGDSVVRAIRRIQADAPRPLRELNPAVPRDVALITLKCIEKAPGDRYESSAELAGELERFLSGHPIRARAPSRLYRARRFVARNSFAVLLVASLFAAVSLGGMVAAVQARRIADQRDRVHAEAAKVASLNRVLESLWQSVDPWKAGNRDARVLDVLRDIGSRIEIEMKDTPLLASAVRNTLGNTWRSLGTLEDFAESERHLRYAFDTRRTLLGRVHLDTARSANDLAETLYWAGSFDEALELLLYGIAIRRQLLPDQHADLAASLNNCGSVLKQLDRLDAATPHFQEALAIRARLYASALAAPDASQRDRAAAAADLAETRNNLGALHRTLFERARDAGDSIGADAELRAALTEYRAALELRRVWLGDAHPSTATSENNLARALQSAGQFDDAERRLREALRILRSGVGERHQLVARALHNLACLKRDMRELPAARELAESALSMRVELLGPSHRETLESMELVHSLSKAEPP